MVDFEVLIADCVISDRIDIDSPLCGEKHLISCLFQKIILHAEILECRVV